eukprot:363552-Chlamydomonas_euryale.AAC.8
MHRPCTKGCTGGRSTTRAPPIVETFRRPAFVTGSTISRAYLPRMHPLRPLRLCQPLSVALRSPVGRPVTCAKLSGPLLGILRVRLLENVAHSGLPVCPSKGEASGVSTQGRPGMHSHGPRPSRSAWRGGKKRNRMSRETCRIHIEIMNHDCATHLTIERML